MQKATLAIWHTGPPARDNPRPQRAQLIANTRKERKLNDLFAEDITRLENTNFSMKSRASTVELEINTDKTE